MYFAGIPSGLPEEVRTFAEKLSGMLERLDPSMLDRARCAVVREEAGGGTSVRIELPHRGDAGYALKLCPHPDDCLIYFGDAHKHFEGGEWQERALDFLQAVLSGRIEVRTVRIGGRPALVKTCFNNGLGEWTMDGMELYRLKLGIPKQVVQRACFFTDADFLRLQRLGPPDDGAAYTALPDDPYFSKFPVDVPEGARGFFDLLREKLVKHTPPMLDGERTRAYRMEDDEGEAFLRVRLPHLAERECRVSADVYFNRCLLYYGNGRMLVDGEGWMDDALTMIGLVLTGQVAVRSIYRGGHLSAVVTRFLDEGPGRGDWTRRFKRKWLGKKRVDEWRTNYFV